MFRILYVLPICGIPCGGQSSCLVSHSPLAFWATHDEPQVLVQTTMVVRTLDIGDWFSLQAWLVGSPKVAI